MPFVFGIGDEVLNCLLICVISIVIFFGWKSTSVRQQSQPNIFDRRLFRTNVVPNIVNVSRTSSRSESRESNLTEQLVFEEVSTSIEELTQTILTEATDSLDNTTVDAPSLEELEQEAIIRVMDHNVNEPSTSSDGLRHRNVDADQPAEAVVETSVTKDSLNVKAPEVKVKQLDLSQQIRIKLKYLNDDLKETQGNLEEAIGDFKKRNFTVEIAAHKLVRLVFNGHLLQPETKSLKSCGLFDNCVVHCLIHNKKNNQQQQQSESTGDNENSARELDETTVTRRVPSLGHVNEEHRRGRSFRSRDNGTAFCYLGMALVTATLFFCWFARLQYSNLFSFYSTVGLILITILFLIMIPLLILIERNEVVVN